MKASLLQRPRALIVESSIPAAAAAVAAPILKLWPANDKLSKPLAASAFRSSVTKSGFRMGCPSRMTKNGPGWSPRAAT